MEESINQIEKMIYNEYNDWSSSNPILIKNCFSGICKIMKSQSKLILELANKKAFNPNSSTIKEKEITKSPQKNNSFYDSTNKSNYQLIKQNSQKIELLEGLIKESANNQDLVYLKNQVEQKLDKEICVSKR